MKKFKFISAIALTLMMASCDDYELPNPPGQTNPEPEAVFQGANLEIAEVAAKDINLVKANEDNKFIEVATISKLEDFPADYNLVVEMEVGVKVGEKDYDFSKSAIVPTVIENDVITVNPDLFDAAIQQTNTKKPGIYDTPVRFVAYAAKGSTKMRIGGLDATFCEEEFTVKTLDPAKELEEAYYLVPCDANQVPDFSKAILMKNTSGEGVSTYDNPELAIKIDVTEEDAYSDTGYMWKIASATAYKDKDASALEGCLPAGDEKALSGKLGLDYNAGQIFLQGPVLVTVNVELGSYRINYALDALYPLSGLSLQKPGNALLLYTNNYINYQGVSVLGGLWYLCGQPSIKTGTVFKQDDAVGFEDSEDGLTRTGGLTPRSTAGQLKTPVSGSNLYWMDVNLVQLTYSITCIQNLSVVGDANGWNETYEVVEGKAPAVKLTANKDKNVWTADGVKIDGDFKINANGTWAVNFGGQSVPDVTGKHQYNLVFNSTGNMDAPAGTYKVTVDFRTYPYTLTLE